MRDQRQRLERLRPRPRSSASRLFFALWPDAVARDALSAAAGELSAGCGGRMPDGRDLHLTLAFLGTVPDRRLHALAVLADGMEIAPFSLTVDRIGCWRRQRLVWVGPGACPPSLAALAAALKQRLQATGFRVEQREFAPHVTLLRDIRQPPQMRDGPSISWWVGCFVLAQSRTDTHGVHYDVVKKFALGGVRAGL